jgi:hypothetical protein
MNKIWSEIEVAFIKENAGKLTDAKGAEKLSQLVGRPISVHAWRKQRQKMALRKLPGRSVCRLAGEAFVGESFEAALVASQAPVTGGLTREPAVTLPVEAPAPVSQAEVVEPVVSVTSSEGVATNDGNHSDF